MDSAISFFLFDYCSSLNKQHYRYREVNKMTNVMLKEKIELGTTMEFRIEIGV